MSLEAIANLYISKLRPRAQEELEWFSQKPSLESAIEYAALAVGRQGKRYSHQRRLTNISLKNARQLLLDNVELIAQAHNFEELLTLLEQILAPVYGLSELYIYDTALRIGAKLNLLPEKVYLHAGTREGARILRLDWKAKALPRNELPNEFQQLEPHEIEDILCIFKDQLKTTDLKKIEAELKKNCWYSC